jgi:hypothetical protein
VKLLALLPATALVFGCLDYSPDGGPAAGSAVVVIHALLALAIVFVWFLRDAKARGFKVSIALKLLMPTVTFAALPYYLFRSRGFAGGLKALVLALVGFVGTMIAYHVGTWFG